MISAPRVALMLATYNGLQFLPEQLETLLHQSQVDLEIFISDDFSTDGTWQYVNSLQNNKIHILPREINFKSAAGNFFHLLMSVDISSFDYVALSDQDDVWNLDKLDVQIRNIRQSNSDACSSDVTAFWGEAKNPIKKKYICKSQPIGKWNHLFESAGPGCTFVFKALVITDFKNYFLNKSDQLADIDLHDWLLFSFAKSRNYKWTILPKSTLLYRQHANNVIGVNSGWRSFAKRINLLTNGWFLQQIIKIAKLCGNAAKEPLDSLQRLSIKDLFSLIKNVPVMRRKKLDQLIFAFYLIYLYIKK